MVKQATGGGTCDVTKDSAMCKVPICPVDGKWSSWTTSGKCRSLQGCGQGLLDEVRKCEGRKGTGKLCRTTNGFKAEYEKRSVTCDSHPCPIDCVLGGWYIPTCRAECDSSKTVKMTRPVETPSAYGGKKCGITSKSHTCYGSSCSVWEGVKSWFG